MSTDKVCENCQVLCNSDIRVKRGKFYCMPCYKLELAKPPIPSSNDKQPINCWRCKLSLVTYKEEMSSAYREGDHIVCYTCHSHMLEKMEWSLFD